MKRPIACLSFALLAFQSAPATGAEQWVIYKDATAAWGYNAGTLARDASGTINATYASYTVAPAELKGRAYHYIVTDVTFDCGKRTARYIKMVSLDDDAGTVDVLSPGDKIPAKPIDDAVAFDTITQMLFGMACESKIAPKGGMPAGDRTSALAKMKAPN